jgi:hypothetical protein
MEQFLTHLSHFDIPEKIKEINPFGSGHIHDTFLVNTGSTESRAYILQKLNTNVFRDHEAVMKNTRLVTEHIRTKLEKIKGSDLTRGLLTMVQLKNKSDFYKDEQGNIWRVFVYIPDHRSYDKAENAGLVYEGGKAYGNFLSMLADFPVTEIKDTIPDFHNLEWRLTQFDQALKSGRDDRKESAKREIRFIIERKNEMLTIRKLGESRLIPTRIVHHDTKINNVLYSNEGKALCVIDLDTVMPGFVHDDFGDAIRTFTNTGEEDDADLSKVSMNITYFEAFARGYLESAGFMLTSTEKEHLALSARVMTYMQSIRFLSDYINGDIYYRIHHPEHNIQRTRAQIALLESMEKQYNRMVEIIKS